MSNHIYEEINGDELTNLFNGDLVLVVTATDVETSALHSKIKPLTGYEKVLRVYDNNLTYYFGLFGKYKIAHVQCAMGSISRDSSIMTVSTALKKLKAKIVIMVGIAFGVDEDKQKIGDVFISESVVPYNSKRVGRGRTIHRGIEAQSSQVLLNRIKNIRTWEYFVKDGVKAKLIFTRLLSGEELVDNLIYRNKLVKTFPDSKGGEMEGAGVYAACGNKIDWILIKGICDFADGNKGKDKKANQTIAIESALSVCLEIFNSSYVFQELKVNPYNIEKKGTVEKSNINEVLFDFYDAEKEPYYIERSNDGLFLQTLKQYGVWVYGPSGSGKSNLIIRNLLSSGVAFVQINLAPCIGQSIEDFFKEIFYELVAVTQGINIQTQPKNFAECSKAFIALLNKHYLNKELVIFVEEIPISTEAGHREFSEKIFSLVISKNFISGLGKIKFVLSSINNPSINVSLVQQKIHQYVSFLPLEYWPEVDISKLVDLILKEFALNISEEFKIQLIRASKGSPRFIKKFFRSIYTLNKTDEATLKLILTETVRELTQ